MVVLCCVNVGVILYYKMYGYKYLSEVVLKKGCKFSCCLLSIRVFFIFLFKCIVLFCFKYVNVICNYLYLFY